MGSSCVFFLVFLSHLIITHSSPSIQPLCHVDESSALLQFKESFIINGSDSSNKLACPLVQSTPAAVWWDGVICDKDTGHVIDLDMSSSCLFGSVNSNSSLFQLVHLQRLNLAYNNFNYSQIPSQVGNLSGLTYLNLTSLCYLVKFLLPLWTSQNWLFLGLHPTSFKA